MPLYKLAPAPRRFVYKVLLLSIPEAVSGIRVRAEQKENVPMAHELASSTPEVKPLVSFEFEVNGDVNKDSRIVSL